jgi:hypothetical protein
MADAAHAAEQAGRGWPAFLSEASIRELRTGVRVRRSVLDRRVSFGEHGEVEYALVPGGGGWYQRVDAGATPHFPAALAPRDLPPGARGDEEIRLARGGQEATYVRAGAHWRLVVT